MKNSSHFQPPRDRRPSMIGSWPNNPLQVVEVAELKGHLALLRAFASLRASVEGLEPSQLNVWNVQMLEDKDRRWARFVGQAVER